jgi:N-acetylmuramoyl-L-alanine amidase
MKVLLGVLLATIGLLLPLQVQSASLSIVLDPGHGGTDPGSTECAGYPEKQANLDIANKLKTLLEGSGYTVYLTRTDDSTKSNNDRYTFANSVGGNALVSIHLNGSTNHSANGTQGLFGQKRKDEAFTRTVHQALVGSLGISDRGVTNFPSGVLLKSNMPSTLQESVFISNTTECQLLTDGTGNRQQQIAQALFSGINNWFTR